MNPSSTGGSISLMNLGDTIVAISSPPGAAARGIVRLSGPQAFEIAHRILRGPPNDRAPRAEPPQPGDPARSAWVEGSVCLGESLLPAAAYVFPAPHSFTREDVVELHLLGAPGVLALVVEACLAAGARRAEPGEFTARAYLAGAFDLSQVHAVAGMIAASSDHQLRAAERLLHGALGKVAREARAQLAELISLVEGALDFADEPIEFITPGELRGRLAAVRQALETTAAAGLRAERWGRLPRVVLAGPPNVGKSSLMNRLTGLDRSICAPTAGTTRDVLSAPLAVGDFECLLVDAAGIDETASGPEAQAQEAVRREIGEADLILHITDATAPLALGPGVKDPPHILVLNKSDLVSEDRRLAIEAELAQRGIPVCSTSAVTAEGCDKLKTAIRQALEGRSVDVHDAALALMTEHREALEQAITALDRAVVLAGECSEHLDRAEFVAAELHAAAQALGSLVGEEQTEEMLGRIFARFCIGK